MIDATDEALMPFSWNYIVQKNYIQSVLCRTSERGNLINTTSLNNSLSSLITLIMIVFPVFNVMHQSPCFIPTVESREDTVRYLLSWGTKSPKM